VLNEHQLVLDIVAFVIKGDFPRSRLGEKQRGKILASWVSRRMHTIAQFSIRDPDAESSTAIMNHDGSLRRLSSSNKRGTLTRNSPGSLTHTSITARSSLRQRESMDRHHVDGRDMVSARPSISSISSAHHFQDFDQHVHDNEDGSIRQRHSIQQFQSSTRPFYVKESDRNSESQNGNITNGVLVSQPEEYMDALGLSVNEHDHIEAAAIPTPTQDRTFYAQSNESAFRIPTRPQLQTHTSVNAPTPPPKDGFDFTNPPSLSVSTSTSRTTHLPHQPLYRDSNPNNNFLINEDGTETHPSFINQLGSHQTDRSSQISALSHASDIDNRYSQVSHLDSPTFTTLQSPTNHDQTSRLIPLPTSPSHAYSMSNSSKINATEQLLDLYTSTTPNAEEQTHSFIDDGHGKPQSNVSVTHARPLSTETTHDHDVYHDGLEEVVDISSLAGGMYHVHDEVKR